VLTVVCWLWKGARGYKPAHVNALQEMIRRHLHVPHRFVCLTDEVRGFARGIEVVMPPPEAMALAEMPSPEGGNFPACYRRLWMFSEQAQALGDRVLLMDVDAVITGDITHLVKRDEDFVGWRPLCSWGNMERVAGGMYLLKTGSRTEVWTEFSAAGVAAARAAGYRGSDQAWISFKLGKTAALWPDDAGLYALSDMPARKLPDGACVVQFAGNTKPWNAGLMTWVREHYPENVRQAGDFASIIGSHPGKKFVVMGGAPTLEKNLQGLKADHWISANEHGAKLRPVDYIVAMDEEHGNLRTDMRKHLRTFSDAPIVGPWSHNDVQIHSWPGEPRKTLSGMVAAWVAWTMGAHVVLLAGMDGYQGQTGQTAAMRDAGIVAEAIKCHVRVIGGGPLTKFWPAYDPNEKFGKYKEHSAVSALLGVDKMIEVEVRKATHFRDRPIKPGERFRAMRHELAILLRHRMVLEV
jgi:hypothetical protein